MNLDSNHLSTNLKRKFLYDNDINSIHLLLNFYNLEEDLGNIYPEYTSLSYIQRCISKFLNYRKGNALAAKNLAELFHEDINRFELYIYIEAYRLAFNYIPRVNKLEQELLKNISLAELYENKKINKLFNDNAKLENFRKDFKKNIRFEMIGNRNLRRDILTYSNLIIKPKIFSINKHLDRQLTMVEEDNRTRIIYETELFKRSELFAIYRFVCNLIFKDAIRIFTDAYWYGLCDKVIKRYR